MVFTSQICVFHARPTFSILCIIDVSLCATYMYICVLYIYIYMYIHMDSHVCKLGEVFLAAAGAFVSSQNDAPGILWHAIYIYLHVFICI